MSIKNSVKLSEDKLKIKKIMKLEPVAHIIQTKSKINTFQFVDSDGNAYVMAIFLDGVIDQLAGSFGNTKIKNQPLDLAYFDQLVEIGDEAKNLAKFLSGDQEDERWADNTFSVNI